MVDKARSKTFSFYPSDLRLLQKVMERAGTTKQVDAMRAAFQFYVGAGASPVDAQTRDMIREVVRDEVRRQLRGRIEPPGVYATRREEPATSSAWSNAEREELRNWMANNPRPEDPVEKHELAYAAFAQEIRLRREALKEKADIRQGTLAAATLEIVKKALAGSSAAESQPKSHDGAPPPNRAGRS